MSYGNPHTSTLPTVSVTTGPTYATQINAAIQEIRDTVDALVTPAGLDINADLSFLSGGVNYSATDLKKTAFESQASPLAAASHPEALYTSSGELYYNDASSQQVQITSGGALNMAATGGITGTGYGASGVEVNWNAGSTQYRFKSGSGVDDYAHAVVNDLLLNDGSGNFIRFASPAIAADYTVTWPTAVPASTLPVLMASDGTLSVSGTLANLVAITTSSTVTANGLITANAGLTGGSGQHVTVAGTGRFKHGTMQQVVGAAGGVPEGANVTLVGGGAVRWDFTGTDVVHFPVTLPVGARVLDIEYLVVANGVGDKIMVFYSLDPGTTTPTTHDDNTTNADTGANFVMLSLNLSSPVTITEDTVYTTTYSSADAGDSIAGIQITYDFP